MNQTILRSAVNALLLAAGFMVSAAMSPLYAADPDAELAALSGKVMSTGPNGEAPSPASVVTLIDDRNGGSVARPDRHAGRNPHHRQRRQKRWDSDPDRDQPIEEADNEARREACGDAGGRPHRPDRHGGPTRSSSAAAAWDLSRSCSYGLSFSASSGTSC
jgi:hypothetical protein